SGCKKFLQEKIYTQYNPSTFTSTESGVQLILTGAYSEETMIEYNMRDYFYLMNEFTTDEMNDANGGLYASAQLLCSLNGMPLTLQHLPNIHACILPLGMQTCCWITLKTLRPYLLQN